MMLKQTKPYSIQAKQASKPVEAYQLNHQGSGTKAASSYYVKIRICFYFMSNTRVLIWIHSLEVTDIEP